MPDPIEVQAPQPTTDQKPIKVKGPKRIKDATTLVLSALNRSKSRNTEVAGSENFVRTNEDVIAPVKFVIRTGIHSIDSATGGIPFSRVSEIYGLDACGKSALAKHICAKAKSGEIYEVNSDGTFSLLTQKYEVVVAYYDNENSIGKGERLVVCNRYTDAIIGECDTIDAMFKGLERVCSAIDVSIKQHKEEQKRLEKEGVEYEVPIMLVLFIVDSIAGTSTRQELKQDWAAQDYARQPKLLRDGFRNTIRMLKEYNVCAIFTNQVGDSYKPKPKGMMNRSPLPQESDFNSFGGKALKYYATTRIFLVKTLQKYKLAQGRFEDGLCIHFFVSKNRLRPPLRSGRMVLLFKNCGALTQDEWAVVRDTSVKELYDFENDSGRKMTMDEANEIIPKSPQGGFSEIYSALEHLLFMKMARISASGSIVVNFKKYGVDIAPVSDELKEEDEESTDGDIEIGSRLDWPKFYKNNRASMAALLAKCEKAMFEQNGSGGAEGDESDEEDPLADLDNI